MKASGMLSLLAFALTASAIPMSQPQFGGSGSSSSTANDVTDKAPCTPLTVIFARGTGEPGNIGSIVGPPLLQALQSKLGASSVAFQGVPYAASAAVSGSIYTSKSLPIWVWPLLNSGLYQGNLDDGGNGGSLMTSLAQQALQQCPNTKVVLSGYSQGGFVVHSAASSLASTPPLGAVIFGDPENGQAVANVPAAHLKEYCASGDGVCGTPRTYTITPAHLSYGSDAPDAASFIAALL